MDYILAIDQGTTSTTALIINNQGNVVSESSVEIPQHFPSPGFVEHLGPEIKQSVEIACKGALEKAQIKATMLLGIGITNQRETTCLFDKNGDAVLPFIVWQCRRSTQICEELKAKNLEQTLQKKTGLCLDPYFSATKLLWIMREHPDILTKARHNDILFGTIDSYLCHWLSGKALHITDVTNASRTILMDLSSCQWDDECLDIFSVPANMMPRIVKNIGPYGVTKGLNFLPDGIPLLAMAGDQQAALFGQACFDKGDAKATFGTGSFILLNTGEKPVFSHHGLLTSVAYQINSHPIYCLEGSAFVAGALIQFLRDNLGMIAHSDEIDHLATSVKDNGGVLFIPALCGLSAPYWRPEARGMLCGLDRGVTKGHIARAALEGIAIQNTDIMLAMAEDAVLPKKLKVDGGAAKSDILMQIQADLLGVPCIRPATSQKTALGAAYLAGIACGMFSGIDDIKALKEPSATFTPNPDRTQALLLIDRYHQTIKKAYL
jgi:glycerol kinase